MLFSIPNPIEAFRYFKNACTLWKFKMATEKSQKYINWNIFLNIYDKYTNKVLFSMILSMPKPRKTFVY